MNSGCELDRGSASRFERSVARDLSKLSGCLVKAARQFRRRRVDDLTGM